MKTRMKNKIKDIWCYLDGKKHCEVIGWALGANMMVDDAKKHLREYYEGKGLEVKFVLE